MRIRKKCEAKNLIINEESFNVVDKLIGEKSYYDENGLSWFNDFEMLYFKNVRGSYFLKTYKEVFNYISDCIALKEEVFEAFLGKLNRKTIKKFKDIAGFDFDDYGLCFCKNCIEHVYYKHYEDEEKYTNKIELKYLFLIPTIIENFYEVSKGNSRSVIVLHTKINGENYRCVLRYNNRYKFLSVVSLYKAVPLSQIITVNKMTHYEDLNERFFIFNRRLACV